MALSNSISVEEIKTSNMYNNKITYGEDSRREVAAYVSQVLCDTFSLYMNTLQYHWNVQGFNFYSLHKMFEGQYQELATAIDDIAERVRILGFLPPGALREIKDVSSLPEDELKAMHPLTMIQKLIDGNQRIMNNCKNTINVCNEYGDHGTIDLLVKRIGVHEKNSWMLRSSLE